jgi:hypothetical protein
LQRAHHARLIKSSSVTCGYRGRNPRAGKSPVLRPMDIRRDRRVTMEFLTMYKYPNELFGCHEKNGQNLRGSCLTMATVRNAGMRSACKTTATRIPAVCRYLPAMPVIAGRYHFFM